MRERLLYARYEVTGLNQERLLNTLRSRGVPVYKVRKLQKNRMRLTVSASSESKFFAILNGSCYNVKKLGASGIANPFVRLCGRPGRALGLAILIAACIYANGLLFAVDITGSGAVYRAEIEEVLAESGVKKFGRFGAWDFKAIERAIFASEHFSFVSVEKAGNRLRVRAELSGDPPQVLGQGATELRAAVAGRVLAVKVLRGTACVRPGDYVRPGDLLVSGKVLIGETETEGTVLASVRLECEYVCRAPGGAWTQADEDAAVIFARESLAEGTPVGSKTERDEAAGEYVVTIYYETELYGG